MLNRDVYVTREEVEQAARPVLIRTVRMATETIDTYHRECRDRISAVFLVGGSTRIPLVATLLHQESRIGPVAIEQPEFVVAEGGLHTYRLGAAVLNRDPATSIGPLRRSGNNTPDPRPRAGASGGTSQDRG